MTNLTMLDVIDTCAIVCGNQAPPIGHWLRLPFTEEQRGPYRERELVSDRYVLVLSSSPSALSGYSEQPELSALVVTQNDPPQIGPLLSMMCVAVVLDTSLFGLKLAAAAVLSLASARGVPVFSFNLRTKEPLLLLYVTHALAARTDLHSRMSELSPSSKFPFTLEPDPEGGLKFTPLAPPDFLTDAPIGTPRYAMVMQRAITLIKKGVDAGTVHIKRRYYACFVGDLCMSVLDENHVPVFQVLSTKTPPSVPTPTGKLVADAISLSQPTNH